MPISKVAFVTGVSSGIGRAAAARFAHQGHVVFGSVRDLATAQPIAGVQLVRMDVRDEASIQSAVQGIVDRAGRIDVLVNNAGAAMLGAVEETSVSEARSLFDTNVFGALRTSQAVLPHMRSQRSGRIVNISSVLGFLPGPYMGLYAATQHALEGMSEALDHEVRKLGIRVVLVEPSYTRTNLDLSAPHAKHKIGAYDAGREVVSWSVLRRFVTAPSPDAVAVTIVNAALGGWRMRVTPGGEASLLSTVRRFLPAGPVDFGLRRSLGLA